MNPARLAGILERIPEAGSPNLIVGIDTMDDAGVYKLTDDIAIVQSVDFFFPIVNDPKTFGRIAAANSLSDLWAMGAKALTAMNVLAYPAGPIPPEVIEQLLTGANEKLLEADVALVGGHTMELESFMFGMSVTGVLHPDNIFRNSSARAGDKIIITKRIGTGVYCSAFIADGLDAERYEAFAGGMERLNLYAAEVLHNFDVSAVTDVTGFGLLGHLLPIAKNAMLTAIIMAESVPLLPDALALLDYYNPQGVCKCKPYVVPYTRIAEGLDSGYFKLFVDAQTSGGLLATVHPEQAEDAVAALRQAGDVHSAVIGEVVPLEYKDDGNPLHLRLEA